VAVGTMVALVGVANGFEQSALDTFQKRGADIVVVAAGMPNQLSSDLDQAIMDKIRKIPEVGFVTCGLVDIVSFSRSGSSFYVLVQGWTADNPAFNDFEVVAGRLFKPEDQKVAIMGANVASSLNKKVGEQITIKREKFTVIGIVKSFSVYDNDSIVVKLEELQKLTRRQGRVTGFSITLDDAIEKTATAEKVSQEINELKLGLSALPTARYISESAHIRMTRAMAWLTTLIALLIGTISMANTMAMSVVERTREIGILRAIGWKKWRVIRMIVGESVVLSFSGGLLGIVLAVIACRWFPSLPQVGGFIHGEIAPWVIATGFLIALVVGLIGGIWPAWRAASLPPTEAIYHE